MTPEKLIKHLDGGGFDSVFKCLYPQQPPERQTLRYAGALNEFERIFGAGRDVHVFSAPGRCEIGGNHTDHQRGRVLAAAVDLDTLCIAAKNESNIIRIHSEGYPPHEVDISSTAPRKDERNTSRALVRGIAAACLERGYKVSGFDAFLTSEVLEGSGLSSSAAFEVVVAAAIGGLFNCGKISPEEIARIGQYAENVFFGKPSGLMDQMTSSVGGLISIDFADLENPIIEKVDFDMAKNGYRLCIVSTGGSHANLTHEYAAIPVEMREIAAFFGKTALREVTEEDFYSSIARLRDKCGDRAVLRAIHFLGDNARVKKQTEALSRGDIGAFLEMLTESGRSSSMYLQNLFSGNAYNEQGLPLACAVSEKLLSERGGAWRVHGGGFAGTIEAFVPQVLVEEYRTAMDAIFGAGSCRMLSIRPLGAVEVLPAAET